MATFHLHLKNVPPEAGALDIRRFFNHFDIPTGGVQIVGGPEGHTFVTFANNDDLLKATLYDKNSLMGRQLAISLVNSNDVKEITEKVKDGPTVRSRPMELVPVKGGPRSAWGSSAQVLPPPRETALWHHQAATSPRLAEFSTMPGGREAKRRRLCSQEREERRYPTNWTAPIAYEEEMQMELEVEERIAQDIADQLRMKTEKIERLKHGILGGHTGTVALRDPTREDMRSPQVTMSRAEWERRQHEPQSAHPRDQYHREKRLPPEPYPRFLSRGEPRWERERDIYHGPRYTEDPRYPRFGAPQPARYSVQNDGYSEEEATYAGPSTFSRHSPYYVDQRYGDPRYPQPSENFEDPRYPRPYHYNEYQRPIMDHRGWDRDTDRDQPQWSRDQVRYRRNPDLPLPAKETVPKKKSMPRGQKRKTAPKKKTIPHVANPPLADGPPVWYLRLTSLPAFVTACTVWSWFGGAAGPCMHVILTIKSEEQPGHVKMAYVAFRDYISRNAEKKKYSDSKSFTEKEALSYIVRAVTNPNIEVFKSTDKGVDDLMIKEENEDLIKRWYRQGVPKVDQKESLTESPGSTSQLQKHLTVISKKAVYFVTVFQPEKTTASGVWEEFGGSSGRSLGVLLLASTGEEAETIAFVAYEDLEERNAQLHMNPEARSWSDSYVYMRCANAPAESKVFKSTPTGEDVELSDDQKALLNETFLLESFKMENATEKEKEDERLIINRISASLFHSDTTEEKLQTNSQPTEGNKVEADKTEECYLRLDFLPPNSTACEVLSWFGGPSRDCLNVTLTIKDSQPSGIAFVAFRDKKSRNRYKSTYNGSKIMSVEGAMRRIARMSSISYKILKSSDTGTDQVMTKEEIEALKTKWDSDQFHQFDTEEAPHILQIRDIGLTESACKVWSSFGGLNGPAQSVILMEDCQSKIAFVRFSDLEKCNAEQEKRPSSEIVAEDEMLKMLAACPSGRRISMSTPKGGHNMSDMQRTALKTRFNL